MFFSGSSDSIALGHAKWSIFSKGKLALVFLSVDMFGDYVGSRRYIRYVMLEYVIGKHTVKCALHELDSDVM